MCSCSMEIKCTLEEKNVLEWAGCGSCAARWHPLRVNLGTELPMLIEIPGANSSTYIVFQDTMSTAHKSARQHTHASPHAEAEDTKATTAH